jgi:hypothetical protein
MGSEREGGTHMFTTLKRGQYQSASSECPRATDGGASSSWVCSLDVTYRSSSVGFWVNLSMTRDDSCAKET